jgi:hypothetical protein
LHDFDQFLQAYPATRRKSGDRTRYAFTKALRKVSLETMLTALAQHRRSDQWRDPRFIPSMTTWLDEERWIQVLPEPKTPASRLTPFEQARRAGLK